MKLVANYRENAQACRELAKEMPAAQRDQLLGMAALWERIADEREDALLRAKALPIEDGPRSTGDE